MISRALARSPSRTRSLAKTITWRITGSLDTFVISAIITGDWVFAGSIASTEVITKMILYYLHERGWAHITWGVEAPPRAEEEARAGAAAE